MIADAPQKPWRAVTGHVAVRALFESVAINMLAPAVLYRLSAPHLPANSLVPLAIPGIPPILWLARFSAPTRWPRPVGKSDEAVVHWR